MSHEMMIRWYQPKKANCSTFFTLFFSLFRGVLNRVRPLLLAMIHIRTSPDRKRPRKIFYVCNRERCFGCKTKPSECRHTTQIEFALYDDHDPDEFDCMADGSLWERIRNGYDN